MKPSNIVFLSLCLPIFGCTVSDRADNRNFAFDTYYPTPNEIRLADQRGQRYWQNNSQRFPNSTRYLAVYTTSVLQADIIQDLYAKLISSETTASFFGHGDNVELMDLSCIMIYDTVTNKFVSNLGTHLSTYLHADHWLAGTVTWQGISDGETKLKY